MDKNLEFLNKVLELCKEYHLYVCPPFVMGYDDDYLQLSDDSEDLRYLSDLIDFYESDLPF